LGGPLGVSQILLQQFRTLRNWVHPLSNGDRQITNCAHDLGSTWTTLSDASEEVPMVTQLDEEMRRLWELAKDNLEKGAQEVQGFCRQVPARGEISRRGRIVVEHQELSIIRRFKS